LKVDIILFARSPDLGPVKTRMRPVLSDSQCQQLHKDMLEYAGETLKSWRWGSRYCWHTGMCDYWTAWQERYRFQLQQQSGADLGLRMSGALSCSLGSSDAAIIIGADAILGIEHLDDMAAALAQTSTAVMLPAHDGGYLALGLQKLSPSLFSDMPWGSNQVAGLTRQRFEALGVALLEWPACADIDHPQDLKWLSDSPLSHWSELWAH